MHLYSAESEPDLVLHWGHHALLAVVDRFGNLADFVVQSHGEAGLAVQRDQQAGHLLADFLRRLREQRHSYTLTEDGDALGEERGMRIYF